jgi:hypothetical protein
MNHIMIDLETLGTVPGCAILSIGAVAFNFHSKELGPEFYIVVNQKSCEQYGLKIDRGTLAWWSRQSPEAQVVLKQSRTGGETLPDALGALTTYLKQFGSNVRVWGNGAAFDNAILSCCYASINSRLPWKFTNDRCYRTLKAMMPHIGVERQGVYHNALDDAKTQAVHAMVIMRLTTDALARA